MKSRLENNRLLKIFLQSLDNIDEGLVISDPLQEDNPMVYINEGFVKVTGYPREEVLGKNCRFLQGEETDESKVNKIRDAINKGESCFIDIINYKKDGTKFWNQLSIYPIKDKNNKVVNFVGIQRDISKEKLLLQSESELNAMRTTMQTINDVIFNFMNTIQLLKLELEENPNVEQKLVSNLEKAYNSTIKKLNQINKMDQYKEIKISGDINILDHEEGKSN